MEKARQHPALILLALALGGPAAAQPVAVPSGLAVERIEVIWDEDLGLARFRFLAPGIAAPGFDLRALRPDFDALCRQVAVPEVREAGPGWDEVVLSMSSAVIPFGQIDPDVVQSFEGYRLQGEDCIWLPF